MMNKMPKLPEKIVFKGTEERRIGPLVGGSHYDTIECMFSARGIPFDSVKDSIIGGTNRIHFKINNEKEMNNLLTEFERFAKKHEVHIEIENRIKNIYALSLFATRLTTSSATSKPPSGVQKSVISSVLFPKRSSDGRTYSITSGYDEGKEILGGLHYAELEGYFRIEKMPFDCLSEGERTAGIQVKARGFEQKTNLYLELYRLSRENKIHIKIIHKPSGTYLIKLFETSGRYRPPSSEETNRLAKLIQLKKLLSIPLRPDQLRTYFDIVGKEYHKTTKDDYLTKNKIQDLAEELFPEKD